MLKRAIIAATFALTASTAIPAQAAPEQLPVIGVEVRTEFDAGNVLEFYPDLAADLQKAIWTELDNKVTDGAQGYVVDVILYEILMNGNPVVSQEEGFNQMEGFVEIRHEDNVQPLTTFPVMVSAMQGEAPAGVFVIAPSTDDFYNAMLAGFATAAERSLNETPDLDSDVQSD